VKAEKHSSKVKEDKVMDIKKKTEKENKSKNTHDII
jgi:hypothetical protein